MLLSENRVLYLLSLPSMSILLHCIPSLEGQCISVSAPHVAVTQKGLTFVLH